jgi:hypothetical protein
LLHGIAKLHDFHQHHNQLTQSSHSLNVRCMIVTYPVAPLCVHACCRFPKLRELYLTLPSADDDPYDDEDDDDEGDAASTQQQHNNLLLLGLARMQRILPALRYLQIKEQSWVDNSSGWSTLGKMTQLTALVLDLQQHLHDAVTLEHLSALEPLGSSLKSFAISTATVDKLDGDHQQQQQQQQYDFLRHLTGLSHLCLPVASGDALEDSISSSIAGLTQLSYLSLDAWCVHGGLVGGAAGGIQLGDRICSALAQLTGLAHLKVRWAT